MKRTALLIVLLVASLSIVACSKKEEAQAPAPEKAAETAAATVTEKAAETAAQVEEKAADVAAQVEEKAVEAAAQVEEKAAEAAAATESAVQAATEQAGEVAAKVEEKAAEATEAGKEVVAAVEEKAAEATQAVAEAASGDSIVIENTYGKVTFNHKVHSEAFDCALCHGEGEPGALDLGKEKAHAACKGCHQEKGAGPTKCSECHVK
ncbi:MAG: cytochrome c3 family protein [Trichloromonas sp.]|jgi:hypothetical protein|nr:cytochrome c3 family protein [Trichloromonas sp.]